MSSCPAARFHETDDEKNRAGHVLGQVASDHEQNSGGPPGPGPATNDARAGGAERGAGDGRVAGKEAERGGTPEGNRWGRRVLNTTVALCLTVALTHVGLVFLHVAPPNVVSQRFESQVDAWIYPLFEQNWRLFAPDPDSVNRQISARTAHTAQDGTVQVSDWVDLTAVDAAAIKHQGFPSHTAQNMLRRSWTSYVELHGGNDVSRSARAVMIQQYLRNIAADRTGDGKPFEHIQLRVVTLPVAAPGTAERDRRAASANPETRLLPWWKVASDG
ncbi:hypothetical protein EES43_12960 [Streptomyces sp. ADI96-02]|uniref:DUF5819 family protein n=1 Tax=unclassified Streptomyces TaxID=2593676 RepID=UPI000FAF3475|nr:DUF5819 family protein [Streptomyces sp. ADI96-02]RPK62784.1 hypothetical protein EES43_12960 [Streptomyces sp. ADI96-02]